MPTTAPTRRLPREGRLSIPVAVVRLERTLRSGGPGATRRGRASGDLLVFLDADIVARAPSRRVLRPMVRPALRVVVRGYAGSRHG